MLACGRISWQLPLRVLRPDKIVGFFVIILSKTPLRITLFGGGSDYPSYFKQRVSASTPLIAQYTSPRGNWLKMISVSDLLQETELVDCIDDIEQPVVRGSCDRRLRKGTS